MCIEKRCNIFINFIYLCDIFFMKRNKIIDYLSKVFWNIVSFFYSHFWKKEFIIFLIFCLLFFIIFLRLFFVQIVNHKKYDEILNNQHVSKSSLKADRWDILAYDKAWNEVKLTENITMYNVFIDPKYIWDKERFIELFIPVVYKHLCELNWMDKVDKLGCIKNIEVFANRDILPKAPEFFYKWWWVMSDWYYTYDWTWYYEQVDTIVNNFTTWTAETLIKNALDKKVQKWIKEQNYLWFFTNEEFLDELISLELNFVNVKYTNYVYIIPDKVYNTSRDSAKLKSLLKKYGYLDSYPNIDSYFQKQEYRYIKLLSNVNAVVAQMVKDLKNQYYSEKTPDNVPILHWLWLEDFTTRYYPYWSFLSNVLWYVDKNWKPYFWIEQYFDDQLRWQDWEIIWRSSSFIWWVWANDFEIQDVKDWDNVYLTIDIWIQKEIEKIVQDWQISLKADSISVLVYDPMSWEVKASASYPTFNPNNYNDAYTLVPLWPDNSYIVDDETYIDIPVYIKTGWESRTVTTDERTDSTLEKYIMSNIYGPQVFVDKNISYSYEPWSIFKTFTVAIGLDSDEISLYDFYNDPWTVKVWEYSISNADNKNCMWEKTFMNALIYSCNIWMVRIVQAVWKNNYYNYMNKLWFGSLSRIELAGEDAWSIDNVSTVSVARLLNNAFGQWLLATPIQIAAAYGALVNWWYYMQPTILAWYYDSQDNKYYENQSKVWMQIFRPETAEQVKEALFNVMEVNPDYQKIARVEWFTLWWKSWTSQISYKWKYMQWNWWTNTSFVWLVTKDDPKYIVVVQVRRPRATLWWAQTAWKVFSDVAKFLLWYSFIES